jgi:hypothetical protein
VPEGVSFEDYGRQVSAEEHGDFTPWGYLTFRYKEIQSEYTGIVPEEYKIVGPALGGPSERTAIRNPEEKPSVLKRIRDAEKAPKQPCKDKTPERKKEGAER